MYKTAYKQIGLIICFLLSVLMGNAQYNDTVTLRIGDLTPPLKVHAWVRGTPITEFKKGKVYVLDFWAIWCGGCIASFPHISAISEKYKGRVSFISIDSYEDAGNNKDKDPVSLVTEFLQTPQGQKLTFDVCVDGKENNMFNSWIKTLSRSGFPTTFIIDQEGRIAWIDVNLDHLDWALSQVLAKKWDRNKTAVIMQERDAIEDMFFSIIRKKEADKTEDYRQMLAATEVFDKKFPDRTDAVAFYKFWALAEVDKSKVPALLEKMAADPLSRYINLNDAAGLTLRRKDLSKRDYLAVAKVQERLLLNEYPGTGHGGKSIKAYERIADTYYKAGDPAKATSSIEKAIEMAHAEKASADTIQKLKETLVKYKSA